MSVKRRRKSSRQAKVEKKEEPTIFTPILELHWLQKLGIGLTAAALLSSIIVLSSSPKSKKKVCFFFTKKKRIF